MHLGFFAMRPSHNAHVVLALERRLYAEVFRELHRAGLVGRDPDGLAVRDLVWRSDADGSSDFEATAGSQLY